VTSAAAGDGRTSPPPPGAFERGQWLVSTTGAAVAEPTTFSLLGRSWDLLPGVFAPPHCLSTRFFADSIPYPRGGTLLEMGCGSGVISVMAVLRGCARVTAADISPAAVANTRMNTARHAVSDRVRVIRSDLFGGLEPLERYDLIFWNSPFIEPPAGFVLRGDLDGAVFDPGYQAHGRFLSGARPRLTPAGRLLLGFSSLGRRAFLAAQASASGYTVTELRTSGRLVPDLEYQLLELVPNER
jgi:release factor glutamine methyltransferase